MLNLVLRGCSLSNVGESADNVYTGSTDYGALVRAGFSLIFSRRAQLPINQILEDVLGHTKLAPGRATANFVIG